MALIALMPQSDCHRPLHEPRRRTELYARQCYDDADLLMSAKSGRPAGLGKPRRARPGIDITGIDVAYYAE